MIHGLTTSPLALTRLSTLLVASLAGLHAIAAPTSSQEATPSDDAVRTKFSFEGGTASQLFTQLAEPFPDFPVVLGGMAGDFEISGFEAIITEPRTIVELVCGVEGVLLDPDATGRPIRGMLDYRNVNQELVSISFTPTGFSVQRLTVRVLSIQELLSSGMSIEEIMGTVSAGITLQEEIRTGPQPMVRFHEETGVLFSKGSKAANEMVAETVKALTASAKWRVSPEALEAKEALIRSEALDFLGETTKETAAREMERLKKLMQEHEALMEKQRKREDEKDAQPQRQLDEEFSGEDK